MRILGERLGKLLGKGLGSVIIIVIVAAACRGRTATETTTTRSSSRTARTDRVPAVLHPDRIFPGGVAPSTAAPAMNPLRDSLSIEEGRQLFSAMNCDGCHGGGGTGFEGPSLSDGRWQYGSTDAEVFRSIYYGQRRGMPAYGGVLQPAIVWKIVAYLKALPVPKDVPTEAW